MIELPESHALAEQVKKTLTGKRISEVIANHNPHRFAWFSGNPADYPAIHPKRMMETLSDAEFRRMFGAVKTVIRDMADRGGRDTERDLFGLPGGYKTILSRNTVGAPCPRCGETIRKESYLGGSIYYCPECQRL